MSHRQADLSFRGLGAMTPERLRAATEQRRIIAIGRSVNGSRFAVTAPKPADWPSDEEIEAIIQRCPPKPFTEEDELEARQEERRD